MVMWCNVVPSYYIDVADRGGVSSFGSDSVVAISFDGRHFFPPSSPPFLFSPLGLGTSAGEPPVVAGWIGEGLGH